MNLVERLRQACSGHPVAKIAWPHRILHEAADAIERLQKERDGIDEERRTALALVLERNAQIQALQKELETAREDALEEAAKVAEAMPALRAVSAAHVKSTAPKDVAAAIRALKDKEVADG